MGTCPQGMKEVSAGSVSYTAHSYPRGPETCKPDRRMCKPGWRKRPRIPPHLKRYVVKAPCPYQICTTNKPVKRNVTRQVKAFCISDAVERDAFVKVAVRPSTGIGWAKPGLMSRLMRNKANTLPVAEQFFVNVNHGLSPTAPVRGVGAAAARAYCKAVYGSSADLPSNAQWERAYGAGVLSSYAGYMELLSTMTRTAKGMMALLISKFAKPGFSWAVLPDTMNYAVTFRCAVPKP